MLRLLVLGHIKTVDFPSSLRLLPISQALQGILYPKSVGQLKSVRRDDKTNNHMGKFMSLEKEMVPHPSTLAWKILWTGEPGRLRSMGSLTGRHD